MAEVKRYKEAAEEAIDKAKDFMDGDELTHVHDPQKNLYVPVVEMVAALFELRDDYAALERRLRIAEGALNIINKTNHDLALLAALQAEHEIDSEKEERR